jgi:hypothetical protein
LKADLLKYFTSLYQDSEEENIFTSSGEFDVTSKMGSELDDWIY